MNAQHSSQSIFKSHSFRMTALYNLSLSEVIVQNRAKLTFKFASNDRQSYEDITYSKYNAPDFSGGILLLQKRAQAVTIR